MKIYSAVKEYEVLFTKDPGELFHTLAQDDCFYVIDRNVFELHGSLFAGINKNRLYLLRSEEQKKNIHSVVEIVEKFLSAGMKRRSTLISVGGGITQDITGMSASIYYRGVGWIYFPTTLLAQSDICIGGKTSRNHNNYKNVIGNFFSPDAVYVCCDFLRTLSKKDYLSGVGEIVKLFLISGRKGFEEIKVSMDKLMAGDKEVVPDKISKCLSIKKEYIEKDEFDLGLRGILNFGHTVGHAIESASEYKISHGEAVVIGMDIANVISRDRGILNESVRTDIKQSVCVPLMKDILSAEALDVRNVISYLKKDKKRVGNDHSFILMDNNFNFKKFNDVKDVEVEKAMETIKT